MSKTIKKTKILFVTVGSTKFEQLIDRILDDEIINILSKHSFTNIIMQIGNGKHKNENINDDTQNTYEFKLNNSIEVKAYKYKSSIKDDMLSADLIISHAGAGSIIESLEANKKLIVVINETLMNNHQIELAEKMQQEGYLLYSLCSNLDVTLDFILDSKSNNHFKPYEKGRPELFAKYLDDYLDKKYKKTK